MKAYTRHFYIITLFLFLIVSTASAQKSPAGLWRATSPFYYGYPVAIIKTYITNEKLCGEIVKVIPLNGSFVTSSKIAASGPVMMCDYHEENGSWVGGKIYEQITAKIYPSTVAMSADGNHLYVRGYVGPFYRTGTWNRIR